MTWWKGGVRLQFQPKGIAIALVYAVSCWAAREISLDQFYLPAGVRVAALLILPPRMWIYLLIGEYAYFANLRLPLVDKHGWTWVVLGSVLLMPAAAMIVYKHRKGTVKGSGTWFISMAAMAAAATTTINLVTSHLLWKKPPEEPAVVQAIQFFVGDFIGILTLGSLALLWIRRSGRSTTRSTKRMIAVSALVISALGVAAANMGEAAAMQLHLLMMIPAIALTCIHGWRGAALAVALLHLVIGATLVDMGPWTFHETTFGTQQALAVIGSGLLILGFLISDQRRQLRDAEAREADSSSQLKQSHVFREAMLKDQVQDIRLLGERIDHSLSIVGDCLKSKGHMQFGEDVLSIAAANSRKFREQTSRVYPIMLEHVGLYLTLQVGGIADIWNASRRVGSPILLGDPCQLSNGLQLAAYRAMDEAVALVLSREPGHVRVKSRCFQKGEMRAILVVVAFLDTRQLLSVDTADAAERELTGRVMGYEGKVAAKANRIRILLREELATGLDI